MIQREMLFEKEININATIKNIEKSGYGKKHDPYGHIKIQLFDKGKNIKEIKSKIRQEMKASGDMYIVFSFMVVYVILGIAIGLLMNYRYFNIVAVLFLIMLHITLVFSLIHVLGKRNKWIFFPNPNTVVFAGDFAEEYVNNFRNFIVWKKASERTNKEI